jgi:hypothetical protein
MTTTVTGTAGGVGAISISEEDCAPNECTGQIATVHVQDGAPQDPYLEWKIVVVGSFDGVIEHELDELDAQGNPIVVEISESCVDVGDVFDVDCIESAVKNGNSNEIIFRTPMNGRIRV